MSPRGRWATNPRDAAAYDEGYRDGTNDERARWQEIMGKFIGLPNETGSP